MGITFYFELGNRKTWSWWKDKSKNFNFLGHKKTNSFCAERYRCSKLTLKSKFDKCLSSDFGGGDEI